MNLLDPNVPIDIPAIIVAIGTAGGALIGAWATRRKMLADAAKTEAEARDMDAGNDEAALSAANHMIHRLEAEIEKLTKRVDALELESKAEKARTQEANLKYLNALDRIVELEKEVVVLRRKVAGQEVELARCREGIDAKEKVNG